MLSLVFDPTPNPPPLLLRILCLVYLPGIKLRGLIPVPLLLYFPHSQSLVLFAFVVGPNSGWILDWRLLVFYLPSVLRSSTCARLYAPYSIQDLLHTGSCYFTSKTQRPITPAFASPSPSNSAGHVVQHSRSSTIVWLLIPWIDNMKMRPGYFTRPEQVKTI